MRELIITQNEAGQRFDKYLAKYLNRAPMSFSYKMLRKKNITLNEKKATGAEKLAQGDVVKLFLSDETIEKFSSTGTTVQNIGTVNKISDCIIYEDENVLFINKRAGLLSQKSKPDDISVNEYLIDYLLKSGALNTDALKTFRPSVCNRLDRNTSGLITCGKSLAGLQELSRMFRDRSMDKYYITIAAGSINDCCRIRGYLKKDETKNTVNIISDNEYDVLSEQDKKLYEAIETEYEPLLHGELKGSEAGWHGRCFTYTVLKVKLITGKTHQIRAHLSSIGHPCIGDVKYGNIDYNNIFKEAFGVKFQLLHSYELKFTNISGRLSYLNGKSFIAELPRLYGRIFGAYGLPDYIRITG